jgi:hypothetical protein
MKVTAYFIPNPNFRTPGEYKSTSVDELKSNADMLIESCNGGTYTIDTKGTELTGRGVKCRYSNGNYEVTENLLRKLQVKYNVMTNF